MTHTHKIKRLKEEDHELVDGWSSLPYLSKALSQKEKRQIGMKDGREGWREGKGETREERGGEMREDRRQEQNKANLSTVTGRKRSWLFYTIQ